MNVIEVLVTDEFKKWYQLLSDPDAEAVARVVDLLEAKGISLGFPYSSDIKGSKQLRELRVQSQGKPMRVFYGFDPKRNAVLLIGAVKTDKRFYQRYTPVAEKMWKEYLKTMEDKP
jgi:hypothetical protein